MSEMSERARSEAKDKVKRLTGGGKDKVDASGWTEDEYGAGMMHTEKKLGNRPISKQNLKTGGRAALKHGGRRGRDMGGGMPMSNAGANYVANVPAPPQNRFSFTGQPSPFLGAAGMAKGGKADGHWMEKAFANSHGQLHKELGVPKGDKIPEKKLEKAEHSKSGLERKRANLVEIAKRSHKADGGQAEEIIGNRPKGGRIPRASGGNMPNKVSGKPRLEYPREIEPKTADTWLKSGAIKPESTGNENTYYTNEFGHKFYAKNYPRDNAASGGRIPRKDGGSAGKGKMTVNIIVAQKPEHPPAGPPGMAPPPGGMPPRPMPIPAAPPGAPPGGMAGGPNMPPPSMGAGAPPPQMPRASGGKVYPDMKYSAAGGLGRMEKAKKYGDCP